MAAVAHYISDRLWARWTQAYYRRWPTSVWFIHQGYFWVFWNCIRRIHESVSGSHFAHWWGHITGYASATAINEAMARRINENVGRQNSNIRKLNFCILKKFLVTENASGQKILNGLSTVRVEWTKDENRAWRMSEVPDSEETFPCDLCILAMGFTGPERVIFCIWTYVNCYLIWSGVRRSVFLDRDKRLARLFLGRTTTGQTKRPGHEWHPAYPRDYVCK